MKKNILILDFGSQYTQLIARRVRECGVYCEIFPYNISAEKIQHFAPAGIILSGGPETVTQADTPRAPQIVFELNCPVLGICYGMQTMAEQLGGKVSPHAYSEFGHAELTVTRENILFNSQHYSVWMSHGDQVLTLPENFECIAQTKNTPIAAMANTDKHFYGVQFHPEVTHTPEGKIIFQQFLFEICQCQAYWTTSNIAQKIIDNLKNKITDNHKVILGLSGGVDSLVAAILLQKAIGENLICVYVDTGLQRQNEAEYLLQYQTKKINLNIIMINAKEKFLKALENIADPELKRKIIGKLFIDIFMEQSQKISGIAFLAQGTIYSDVIESSSIGHSSHVIKSHHNVGGLPEKLGLPLIEPLRECFKDEVREIGLYLGLSREEVYRHPFPGPGLAVRILGKVTPEALDIVRQADHIFMEELREHDLYHKISQAFCVYLPVNSVGVTGDARLYGPIIALRAVESIDFMTAAACALSHEFLHGVARRITNEVNTISRVVYDITSKPPATIEWE